MNKKHIEIAKQKLGFNSILETVKGYCLTELAGEKLTHLPFLTSKKKIEQELQAIDELREIMTLDYAFPFHHFSDLRTLLLKINTDKAPADTKEIHQLYLFLKLSKAVEQFFLKEQNERFKALKQLSSQAPFPAWVYKEVHRIIDSKGEIRDHASEDLFEIRKTLRIKTAEVSRKIQQVYAKVKQSGWLEADLSVTIVNGRAVIPVDSTHKRKVSGLVHDVSATGKTSYIEPKEVLNINNEIVDLEYRETQEIKKIIHQLCEDIKEYVPDIKRSFFHLVQLDTYRARAKYAIQIQAIKPAVVDESCIRLSNARHPLLYLSLKKDQRTLVPLNLTLKNKERIVLISGPNAGGKSVAMKTVGLIQLMLQHCFLVPVGGSTELGLFKQIFIDIGDEQSIDNDLSTYSSHLLNMKLFLKEANNRSLILIDEFGSGTEPTIGGAIAESVLEQLNENQTFGVITSHYSNLKHLAIEKEGLVNAAMLFDTMQMQALFQLELHRAGSSFAFEIARKIGLPESIIQRASSKIGEDQVNFDKYLREVLRDKKYWNDKRIKIKQKEKESERLLEELNRQSQTLKEHQKSIDKKYKKEAEALLDSVNKKIENTILDIKKAQAEKEKTKAIRQEFEQFKNDFLSDKKKAREEEAVLKKIAQLTAKQERKKQNKKKDKTTASKSSPKQTENASHSVLKIGDKIRLKGSNTYGEIIKIKQDNAEISVGEMRMRLPLSKLEAVSKNTYKKKTQHLIKSSNTLISYSGDTKLNFKSKIDLRGQSVSEAIESTQHFIDDAITCNATTVKILHGTGTGALKQAVREYLKGIPEIRSVRDENIQLGGAGITVIEF